MKKSFIMMVCVAVLFGCQNSGNFKESQDAKNKMTPEKELVVEKGIDDEIVGGAIEIHPEIQPEAQPEARPLSIPVFITDNDVTTNVRNAPGGEVECALQNSHRLYYFHVTEARDNWLKIEKSNARSFYCQRKGQAEGLEELDNPLENIGGECWIHNTVVRTSIIGWMDMPAEIDLYASPDSKDVTCTINKDFSLERLTVMQICGNWVQLKNSSGKLGWFDGSNMGFELYFEMAL